MRAVTAAAVAAVVVLAIAAPVGAAGSPKLVKNINPNGSSFPTSLTQVGNTLFFAANDGVHGTELWKSDGTAAGTKMVKDIRSGAKSSDPENLVNVNGKIFFTANDGKHKNQLWKSDGTGRGTVRVTNIINWAYDTSYGLEMPLAPVAIGARLFFFNLTCCMGTSEAYVTDGTSTGTKRLTDNYLSFLTDSPSTAAFKGKFYFAASSASGSADVLWVSDGSVAGTHELVGSPDGDRINILPVSGQNLYFAIYNENNYQPYNQLWKTDGTKRGTKPLTLVGELGGMSNGMPDDAAYMAKRLYFSSYYWDSDKLDYYGQLWQTNGTAAGTNPVLIVEGYAVRDLTTSNGKLFFTVNDHLWKSDGTAAGSTDLGAFGAQSPRELIAVGDELCFAEMDWNAGTWSLWESNGTSSGTYQVGTFAGSPEVLQKAAVGTKLFFAANDISHGMELWSYTP